MFFACGILGGIAIIAFAPGAPWSTNIEPTGATTAEALDLATQRSMAASAWWMVVASAAAAAVGLATLVLVANTLNEARRSADAARDAVKATLTVGKKQTRAYLVVENANLIATDLLPSLTFTVDVRNTGQSPAQKVRARGTLKIVKTSTNAEGEVAETIRLSMEGSMQMPDISAAQSMPFSFGELYLNDDPGLHERLDDIFLTAKANIWIDYEDVFGDEDTVEVRFSGGIRTPEHTRQGVKLKPVV
ncbi:MAG: hypothetical protein BGO80_04035 [Devosia sp. 63-57]|nr:MAG: hypothetical protein BGO80_04035 [Devosia sp. 63-57]